MFGHVADFAMHRHRDLRTDQTVHLCQLFATWMTGDMDEVILYCEDFNSKLGELVVQFMDRNVVPRNDTRREDHRIARPKLHTRMIAPCNARERPCTPRAW